MTKASTQESTVPDDIKRLLQYPNVFLTEYSCPHSYCDERLAYTGTKHMDITDDAGYIVGHKEEETFKCFNGHQVNERGPQRNTGIPSQ